MSTKNHKSKVILGYIQHLRPGGSIETVKDSLLFMAMCGEGEPGPVSTGEVSTLVSMPKCVHGTIATELSC